MATGTRPVCRRSSWLRLYRACEADIVLTEHAPTALLAARAAAVPCLALDPAGEYPVGSPESATAPLRGSLPHITGLIRRWSRSPGGEVDLQAGWLLVRHKGQNPIAAAVWVVRAIPDARLVILSEGELRTQLEQQVKSLGLERHRLPARRALSPEVVRHLRHAHGRRELRTLIW